MDRRSFLRGAGAVTAGAAAATLAAPALAQGRVEWRLVMPWPPGLVGLQDSVARLVARIAALSDGRLNVIPYNAGQLVPALDEFAAVGDGRAELYHAPDYYYAGTHSALNFFTNAPLGLSATEHAAWIEYGGGQALWDELSGGFGIKPLLAGNTGTQMAGWFKQPLVGLASLQGLKFRMPGFGGEVWQQLGMDVVTLPGSEILAALADGRLDGADWVGPWNDVQLRLYTVATNYYYPSLVEGGAALTLGVNRTLWDGLSATDKAILQVACQAEYQAMLTDYQYYNAEALVELAGLGIPVQRLPEEITDGIAAVAPAVVAAAATDDLGRRIYTSYLNARDRGRAWSELAEGAFLPTRQRVLDRPAGP